jgi:hypothetical protein
MNKTQRHIILLLLGVGLGACASNEWSASVLKKKHMSGREDVLQLGPEGVVVAETAFDGMAAAGPRSNMDCDGPGYGVQVQTSTGKEAYTFGADGEPCQEAQTLFDGQNPLDRRLPPPSIHIAFQDHLGPQPGSLATMPRIDLMPAASKTPAAFAATGQQAPVENQEETQPSGINLDAVVAAWNQERVLTEQDKLMADVRGVRRLSTQELTLEYQDRILELSAQLREAERQSQLEDWQHSRTQMDAMTTQKQAHAAKMAWRQEENRLRTEREALKNRLAALEELNQRLAKNGEEKERLYQEQIARLSGDLKMAEKKADGNRRQLVLEAAKKIAEAERLAFAARMDEKDQLARAAARERQESDLLLQRALDLEAGRTIMAPALAGLGPKNDKIRVALEEAPVVIHAEDKTLQEIVSQLFGKIKPMIGDWQVSWQLSGDHRFLLEETWTLTAEATVDEVMTYIAGQVAQAHGVKLRFQQFDRAKTFVISDEAGTPAMLGGASGPAAPPE